MIEHRGQGNPATLPELRGRLDQMTGRITARLKDRTRFPANPIIYQPDGVPIEGRSGISFLEFSIEGLEKYHASLGRYDYSDQYPVLGSNLPSSQVRREENRFIQTKYQNIDSKRNLIPFYQGLVEKYCDPGNDPDSYGETAYLDADLIEMIHERVNVGRYVGETKGVTDQTVYEVAFDREKIIQKIKAVDREEALISNARAIALAYELNPDMAEDAFRWMIDQTIDIEIAFIQAQVTTGNLPQNTP